MIFNKEIKIIYKIKISYESNSFKYIHNTDKILYKHYT